MRNDRSIATITLIDMRNPGTDEEGVAKEHKAFKVTGEKDQEAKFVRKIVQKALLSRYDVDNPKQKVFRPDFSQPKANQWTAAPTEVSAVLKQG